MAVELATGYIALAPVKAQGFDGDLRQKFKDIKAGVALEADVPRFTSDVTGKLRADKGSFTKAGKDIGDNLGAGINSGVEAKVKSGKGLLGGFGAGLAGGFAAGAVSQLAGAVLGVGKESFEAYNNQTEAAGKSAIVFGEAQNQVSMLADTAAKKLGLSKLQALDAAGGFGALFRAMQIGNGTSAEMATTLVKLGSDLGAFYNTSNDDALAALKSGLVGETEPLRQFGVNLNEARIQAEALRLGLVKGNVNMVDVQTANLNVAKAQANLNQLQRSGKATTLELSTAQNAVAQAQQDLDAKLAGSVPALDAATKAQATYSLIMQDTSLAQGNFALTADNAAQKTKTVNAEFEDLKASFGEKIAPVGSGILSGVITGLDAVKAWWAEHGPGLQAWFKDTFGEDPGANFRLGLSEIKTSLDGTIGDWWTTNFGTMEDMRHGITELFGEDPGANFRLGVDMVMGKLTGITDWWQEHVGTFNDFKAGLGELFDKFKALTDNPLVRALNAPAGAGTAVGDLLKNLLGFDSGGIVPGRTGAPMLAMVHGGETILPTHRVDFTSSFGSIYQAPAPTGGRTSAIGDVTVNLSAGSTRQGAADMVHELRGLGLRSRGGS